MADVAEEQEQGSSFDYADLEAFEVTVLSPHRTLAEKLAFLHHRATQGDAEALQRGARHLYDVAMILRHEESCMALDESPWV
jgi:hypothetical protein